MAHDIHNPTLARHQIDAIWLIRLRWGSIAGQLLCIALVHLAMGIALPLIPLVLVVLAQVVFNVVCMRLRAQGLEFTSPILAAFMSFDVLALSVFL